MIDYWFMFVQKQIKCSHKKYELIVFIDSDTIGMNIYRYR